jgi:hypothetical protein
VSFVFFVAEGADPKEGVEEREAPGWEATDRARAPFHSTALLLLPPRRRRPLFPEQRRHVRQRPLACGWRGRTQDRAERWVAVKHVARGGQARSGAALLDDAPPEQPLVDAQLVPEVSESVGRDGKVELPDVGLLVGGGRGGGMGGGGRQRTRAESGERAAPPSSSRFL